MKIYADNAATTKMSRAALETFVKTAEERDYRIMDVLQLNIRQDDGSFLMKDCLYGLHAEVECSSRHMFTLLGISRTGEVSPQFTITETAVKAY